MWPTDLDAFGHMNNARYLAVMDLARIDLVVRLGLLPAMVRNRWLTPVVTTRLVITPDASTPTFHVDAVHGDDPPVRVARGKLFSAGRPGPPVPLADLRRRLAREIPVDALYARLADRGLRYGPAFRAVERIRVGDGELLAEIALPDGLDDAGFHLHPVLLDAALHALVALARPGEDGEVVPVAIDRLQRFAHPGRRLVAWGRVRGEDRTGFTGDLTLAGEDGEVIAEVAGLACRVLRRPDPRDQQLASRICARTWRELPAAAGPRPDVCWFVLGGPVAVPGAEHVGSPGALARAVHVARDRRAWVLDLRFVPGWRGDPVSAGSAMCVELLETVRAIEPGSVDRYCLVTTGAERVRPEDGAPDLGLAPLVGLARTVATERPDLQLTLLDVDRFEPEAVVARLQSAGDEQELAARGDATFAVRIARTPLWTPPTPPRVRPADGAACALVLGGPGQFEAIGFEACDRPAPGPGQVEIAVEIVSIGFKDVMKALGLLTPRLLQGTFFGDAVGMEGAGRVARVGPGVDGLAVGDRVYGVAPGFLRSHVVLDASRVGRIPPELDLIDGSYQLVFMTVWHALVDVARLQPGETVLIHGASGGVGLAAIEVARWCGAEVIGTAGSEEKRRFLRERGVERVSGSRDVGFADDVRRWTGGRGVDVVLNFMPGEIVARSLGLLARFGRFVEIGKMSFEQDAALQLRPFNENLLYAAIDFDRILAHKPDEVARISRAVVERLVAGDLKPLPARVFPASEVGEALRTMAREATSAGSRCRWPTRR